jgi:hypothetical protein
MDGGTGIMAELSRGQILKNPEVLGSGTEGAKIRFLDGDESNHIDVKIPDSVSTNYTFTLPNNPGTNNYYLKTDGNGVTSWGEVSASPGGSDTQIQFNDGGVFAGDVDLTWNKTTNLLDINGNLQLKATGEIRFADTDSSNYVSFKAPGTVAANRAYTLPATIGTVGQVLKISTGATSTAATLEWADDLQGGAGATPGGSDTQVQFNDGGSFGGDSGFTYNKTTDSATLVGSLTVGGVNATTGTDYKINNTSVLTSTTLGSGVLNSSLTSVGTLGILAVDNITINDNEVSSTNTNGNIDLNPNGTGFVRILDDAPLRLMDADNSNFVAFSAPAAVTSDYTITLPAAGGAANDVLQFDGSQNASFVSNTRTLNFVIDGGGSAITTGKKGVIVVDGDYTVTGWTVIADVSGSIVVDVNRATYTNFPTTASIAGTELPTLSSVQKNEDLSLTSWTTTLSARDVLEFEVDSASTVTRVTVALRLVPR